MSTQVVADRYADALFQAATAQGGDTVARVDAELAEVAQMLRESPDLARMWKHPVVDVEDKKAMIRQLLGGKAHPFTLNGLQLLFDKKRGAMVEDVQKAFRALYDATRRRATVKVTSAMPLEQGQADELRQQLAAKLAKEIQMETAVDPNLIGGLVVQIEDQVIDNSVRGRLEALRHALN